MQKTDAAAIRYYERAGKNIKVRELRMMMLLLLFWCCCCCVLFVVVVVCLLLLLLLLLHLCCCSLPLILTLSPFQAAMASAPNHPTLLLSHAKLLYKHVMSLLRLSQFMEEVERVVFSIFFFIDFYRSRLFFVSFVYSLLSLHHQQKERDIVSKRIRMFESSADSYFQRAIEVERERREEREEKREERREKREERREKREERRERGEECVCFLLMSF